MANRRKTSPTRLGHFARRDPDVASTSSDMVSLLSRLQKSMSPEGELDAALRSLNGAAAEALIVFDQAGLPSKIGEYAILAGNRGYLPLAVRDTPISALHAVNPSPEDAKGQCTLHGLGEREHPRDSAVGFASLVLAVVEQLRGHLKLAAEAQDWAQVHALNRALALHAAAQALRREFIDGPHVAASIKAADNRSSGGAANAVNMKLMARRAHLEWQAEAFEVRRRYPSYSAIRVAAIVKENLGLSVAPRSITRALKGLDTR